MIDVGEASDRSRLMEATFPSISTLMSLEEAIVHELLIKLSLASVRAYCGTSRVSANQNGWERFLAYHKLDIEVTTFEIKKKKNLFLRLGSWESSSHPKKTPGKIWQDACATNSYPVPKLRIGTLVMRFAADYLVDFAIPCSNSSAKTSSLLCCTDSNCNSNATMDAVSVSSSEDKEENYESELANKEEFPLLHRFRIPIKNDAIRDKLMQEIVKYYGGGVIKYNQVCNKQGALTRVPTNSTMHQYTAQMRRKGSFIDEILQIMSNNTKESVENAAECIISFLAQRYEENFVSVATEKGIAFRERKMEAARVEAMLMEAGVNRTNSRILFRHLNHFFGASLFDSEKLRRSFFEGMEFPPTTDIHVLPDKT